MNIGLGGFQIAVMHRARPTDVEFLALSAAGRVDFSRATTFNLDEFVGLAAEKGELPRLLEWTDLKGSLHNHSNWSDGRGTLQEIADYMQELGCSYWAINDHSKSSIQANGLDAARLGRAVLLHAQALWTGPAQLLPRTVDVLVARAGGKLGLRPESRARSRVDACD